jgi:1-deoxy-D-xylulose-5-phosphate reductoisomerase
VAKKIAVLGSTGSIGTQSLDVISRYPDRFAICGLAAGENTELLLQQVHQFKPSAVSVASKEAADKIRTSLPPGTRLYYGEQGLIEIAAGTDADFVIAAVVGSLGLTSTLAAIEAGKSIGLANKETLVTAGHLVTSAAERRNVRLMPIDSEHSALFQCLNGEPANRVRRLILTASGGSFRDKPREELHGVTVEEALRHPNWSMGAKITIDSATMANKGLEVIEAHWLFRMPYDQIDVVIHPESIVHSLIEFTDGSVMAQLGNPDMRVPIQYALTFPDRWESPVQSLDLVKAGALHFREMDLNRYPCLRMAYESGRAGGTAPAVFNAANEAAVARFLRGEIRFLQIEELVERALNDHCPIMNPDLEAIREADRWARLHAMRD